VLVYVLIAAVARDKRPVLFRCTVGLFVLYSGLAVWLKLGGGFAVSQMTIACFVLLVIFIAILCADIVKNQGLSGTWLVLSLICIFMGSAGLMASRFAGLEYSPEFMTYARLGMVMGAMLQALSLVEDRRATGIREDDFRRQAHEKEMQFFRLREQALLKERKLTENLEKRVKLRTQELTRAMKQLSKSHALLEANSHVDPLTEVNNRQYFNQRVEEEWRRANRSKSPLALVIVDIDNMREINSEYGFAAGDYVMKHVALLISSTVTRGGDVIARYGGDEFAVVLPETDASGARVVVEKIQRKISEMKVDIESTHLSVGVSIFVKAGVPLLAQGWRTFLVEATWAGCHQRMGVGSKILIETH
jgi:diguanylate cyclase (GGDEF)-like protein